MPFKFTPSLPDCSHFLTAMMSTSISSWITSLAETQTLSTVPLEQRASVPAQEVILGPDRCVWLDSRKTDKSPI